jgi:putative addiction module killer protein
MAQWSKALEVAISIFKTQEFENWYILQSQRQQAIIDSRLSKIEAFSHFGDCKYLNGKLLELRWANGLRIYFTKLEINQILILIGGIKHEQKKDIKKARILLKKYSVD